MEGAGNCDVAYIRDGEAGDWEWQGRVLATVA